VPRTTTARCCNAMHRDFERSVKPHLEKMYRAARRILGSDDLAWDAVQDLLVRLWETGRIPPDREGRWLLRSVRNAGLDALRRDRRQRRREGLGTTDTPARERSAEMLEALGCRDDPSHRLRLDELRAKIRTAVERLPDEYRDVFELHRRGDRDYADIASELRLATGTVGSRIHRARAILRRELATEVG